MHEALQYDGVYQPATRLEATLEDLAEKLDEGISLLGRVEVIVFPWAWASSFCQMWETTPGIESVRDLATGRPTTEPWLWGNRLSYRGIDCLASVVVSDSVIISRVRDLREAWGADQVVLIEVDPLPRFIPG